eukprot:GHVN01080670.1.p1 GENE.GHVN01080670.1~~GHVN01080670.1.p1  ORF type:complete len:186 (-),score=31.00 GHVN01080670.1:584-1141(-)
MWSVGCIFAELLLQRPLFRTDTEADMLTKIFELCGSPTEATWPGYKELPMIKKGKFKVTSHTATWRKTFPIPNPHLHNGPPLLSDCGLDLLQQMLTLNPDDRITAEKALKHEYFTKEKPLPQGIGCMPTVPDTNAAVRSKRPPSSDGESDGGGAGRVNARRYLQEMENAAKGGKTEEKGKGGAKK